MPHRVPGDFVMSKGEGRLQLFVLGCSNPLCARYCNKKVDSQGPIEQIVVSRLLCLMAYFAYINSYFIIHRP